MRFDLVTTRLKARPFKAKSLRAGVVASLCPPWLIFILDSSARQEKNACITKLNKVFPVRGTAGGVIPGGGDPGVIRGLEGRPPNVSPARQGWVNGYEARPFIPRGPEGRHQTSAQPGRAG